MANVSVNEAIQVAVFPNAVWVDSWVKVINEDPEIERLGKVFTANVYFKFSDDQHYILHIFKGKVMDVIANPIWDKAWDFGIVAPLETWQNSIVAVPKPFYQDLFGMMWNHNMTIEGDAVKAMQHIRVLKLMLAAMKHA